MGFRRWVFLAMVVNFLFMGAACSDNDTVDEGVQKVPGAQRSESAQAAQESLVALGDDACQEILQKKCVECHYLARVCQRVGDKSKRSWKRTIKLMVNNGAKLNQEEQSIVVDCLYNQSDGVKEACK